MLAAHHLPKSFSMEIVIVGCWNIWIQRNVQVFRAIQPTIQAWRYFLKAVIQLLQFKIKDKPANSFHQWIVNIYDYKHVSFPRAGIS